MSRRPERHGPPRPETTARPRPEEIDVFVARETAALLAALAEKERELRALARELDAFESGDPGRRG